MNIILFGPPGSGKGTQSELLVNRCKMYQISTGDLFRQAIKMQTDIGKKAKEYIDKGQLVPDSVTIELIKDVLSKVSDNFILDGFPRNIAQADVLESLLGQMKIVVNRAIFLEVPTDILLDRLTGRRVCKKCNTVYHIISKPTRREGVCDECGGDVIQRTDDQPEVVGARLKIYKEQTSPLRDYFKRAGKYNEVNGNLSTEEVFSSIKMLL